MTKPRQLMPSLRTVAAVLLQMIDWRIWRNRVDRRPESPFGYLDIEWFKDDLQGLIEAYREADAPLKKQKPHSLKRSIDEYNVAHVCTMIRSLKLKSTPKQGEMIRQIIAEGTAALTDECKAGFGWTKSGLWGSNFPAVLPARKDLRLAQQPFRSVMQDAAEAATKLACVGGPPDSSQRFITAFFEPPRVIKTFQPPPLEDLMTCNPRSKQKVPQHLLSAVLQEAGVEISAAAPPRVVASLQADVADTNDNPASERADTPEPGLKTDRRKRSLSITEEERLSKRIRLEGSEGVPRDDTKPVSPPGQSDHKTQNLGESKRDGSASSVLPMPGGLATHRIQESRGTVESRSSLDDLTRGPDLLDDHRVVDKSVVEENDIATPLPDHHAFPQSTTVAPGMRELGGSTAQPSDRTLTTTKTLSESDRTLSPHISTEALEKSGERSEQPGPSTGSDLKHFTDLTGGDVSSMAKSSQVFTNSDRFLTSTRKHAERGGIAPTTFEHANSKLPKPTRGTPWDGPEVRFPHARTADVQLERTAIGTEVELASDELDGRSDGPVFPHGQMPDAAAPPDLKGPSRERRTKSKVIRDHFEDLAQEIWTLVKSVEADEDANEKFPVSSAPDAQISFLRQKVFGRELEGVQMATARMGCMALISGMVDEFVFQRAAMYPVCNATECLQKELDLLSLSALASFKDLVNKAQFRYISREEWRNSEVASAAWSHSEKALELLSQQLTAVKLKRNRLKHAMFDIFRHAIELQALLQLSSETYKIYWPSCHGKRYLFPNNGLQPHVGLEKEADEENGADDEDEADDGDEAKDEESDEKERDCGILAFPGLVIVDGAGRNTVAVKAYVAPATVFRKRDNPFSLPTPSTSINHGGPGVLPNTNTRDIDQLPCLDFSQQAQQTQQNTRTGESPIAATGGNDQSTSLCLSQEAQQTPPNTDAVESRIAATSGIRQSTSRGLDGQTQQTHGPAVQSANKPFGLGSSANTSAGKPVDGIGGPTFNHLSRTSATKKRKVEYDDSVFDLEDDEGFNHLSRTSATKKKKVEHDDNVFDLEDDEGFKAAETVPRKLFGDTKKTKPVPAIQQPIWSSGPQVVADQLPDVSGFGTEDDPNNAEHKINVRASPIDTAGCTDQSTSPGLDQQTLQILPDTDTRRTLLQPHSSRDEGDFKIRLHYRNIVCQRPYTHLSPEELRMFDYAGGRKYGNLNR